jgi:hypothetical protein
VGVADQGGKRTERIGILHVLLFVPFVAMLSVGFYNRTEPTLAGIPFFYWFQLLWIPLGAALLWPIYRAEERSRDGNGR